MIKEDFAEILGDINEGYIKEAETVPKKQVWVRWGAVAACFCIIAAIAAIGGDLIQKTPTPPDVHPNTNVSGDTWDQWQINFNTASLAVDKARRYIPGYFTERLDEKELDAIAPNMRAEFMRYSGYAGFDGEGHLVDVFLAVTTSIPENKVYVSISKDDAARDYILTGEPEVSVCGEVEYKVYLWDLTDGRIVLAADAVIGGYTYYFTVNTSKQDLEQAKYDFKRVLECFAGYDDGEPDIASIAAENIPEWFDNSVSYEEALNDALYGAYMPKSVPDGYSEESVRRCKDQNNDFLSGLWTRGYDELYWKVYTIRESDMGRLTAVAAIENYDLSLYPIPRASSVPEDLREIVDNPIFSAEELTVRTVWSRAYKADDFGDSSGWRMAFSVRYDDIIVEVRTKGVNPEWVYRQLMLLNDSGI